MVVSAGAGVSGVGPPTSIARAAFGISTAQPLRSGKADCPTHHYGEFHRAKTLRNLRLPSIETCPRSVQYKLWERTV